LHNLDSVIAPGWIPKSGIIASLLTDSAASEISWGIVHLSSLDEGSVDDSTQQVSGK
jgi:integral membrane sensor domain MASE1